MRVPGTAGAAEAGVVRVGAEASVHDQLAVGQLGLVEALRRNGRGRKRVFRDSNLSRGADGVDARVSVARVGALIGRLHFIYHQAAVGGNQHVSAIRTDWHAVSVKTNTQTNQEELCLFLPMCQCEQNLIFN